MFDVTCNESVEYAKRYYKAIQEVYKSKKQIPPIVVVGNKCDLKNISREEILQSFLNDGISIKDLLLASAMVNINVKETFYILLKRIFDTENYFKPKELYPPPRAIDWFSEFVDITFEFST
jgi:GTPase SAR1 family protein